MTCGRPGSEQAAAADFCFGDGAHVAECLRHDQIGLQFVERRQIERVECPFGFEPLADECVDLAAGGGSEE